MAGFRRGVLFTEVVPGATLAHLLRDEPRRTAELLGHTWAELRELHRPEVAQRFSVAIEERSIEGTFVRKFTGIAANVYLDQLAAVVTPLRRVVIRLGRLSAMLPATVAPVLVYGDLKPEHVVLSTTPLRQTVRCSLTQVCCVHGPRSMSPSWSAAPFCC